MRLERLDVERHEDVVRIWLSGRPLDAREGSELVAVAGELREDRDVRVVVLASRAPDLCPGGATDLEPRGWGPDPAAAIAALRPPVVAACRGRVESVGLELALAADVRLAATTSHFSMADVAGGRLPCWGGTQRLPRAIGVPRATSMLLLGDDLDGTAAAEAGLVHRTVDVDGFEGAVEEVVATLRNLAPLALEFAKEAVARGTELSLVDALHLEGDLNHLLQTTTDRAEGLAAFFDKRDPHFSGR